MVSPRSPVKLAEQKLHTLLQGVPLNELPLDFIGTKFFADFYKKREVLGAGTFGVVVKVTEIASNKDYAMKIISRQQLDSKDFENFLNEAQLMALINHPNVIKLKKVHETAQYIFIVMESASGGSLKSFIGLRQINREPITDYECSIIIKQILAGLSHIHKNNVVHRDINPKNILLSSYNELCSAVRIADFGLGAELSEYNKGTTTERCGTIIYMAPEQLKGEKYTTVVDIWATGMIMYILLMNKHPLYVPGDTVKEYTSKLENPVFEFGEPFSELAKDFFQRMCRKDPNTRYTAEEALTHPWITRNFKDPIPLSYRDYLDYRLAKKELTEVLKLFIYLSHLPTAERVLNRDNEEKKEQPKPMTLTLQLPPPKLIKGAASRSFRRPKNLPNKYATNTVLGKGSWTPNNFLSHDIRLTEWGGVMKSPEKSTDEKGKLMASGSVNIIVQPFSSAGNAKTTRLSVDDNEKLINPCRSDYFVKTMYGTLQSRKSNKISKFAPQESGNTIHALATTRTQLVRKSGDKDKNGKKLQPLEKHGHFIQKKGVITVGNRKIFQ